MVKTNFKTAFFAARERKWQKKTQRFSPHRSFHRSYKEDYDRKLELPGLLHLSFLALKSIFSAWKIFLPLLVLVSLVNTFLAGIMSAETYQEFSKAVDETSSNLASGKLGDFAKSGVLLLSTITSGGLSEHMSDSGQIFLFFSILIVWLVTIYAMRHILAHKNISFRDAIYNALGPLLSSLAVLFVIIVQLLPIAIVVITYSAAILTDFLSNPFYALIYFLFAASLILLSIYGLSSSLMALIATATPGVYPLNALSIGSELAKSRRIRLMIRLTYLLVSAIFIVVAVSLPVILLNLILEPSFPILKSIPVVPFILIVSTSFAIIYITTYWYLLYRRILAQND